MSKLSDLCAEYDVRCEVIPALMPEDGSAWNRLASHWQVSVSTAGRGRLLSTFSWGPGNGSGPPPLEDILCSLLRDAQGADQPFWWWAKELGYDTDSRRAESIYNECFRIQEGLRRVLGPMWVEFAEAASEE